MFDQVRFYRVSEPELNKLRREFTNGQLEIRVDKEEFHIAEYKAFLKSIADETSGYRQTQSKAAAIMCQKEVESLTELQRNDSAMKNLRKTLNKMDLHAEVPQGFVGVHSIVTGKVWELFSSVEDDVEKEQLLVSVEAMKMECACTSPSSGTVSSVLAKVGQAVNQGDLLMIIKTK
jgi:urea carboxylase